MRASTKSDLALDLQEPLAAAPAVAEVVALVELGSNAVRCILTSIVPRVGFQVFREVRAQTRLGGGEARVLPSIAMRETVRVVRRFLKDVRREHRPRVIGLATSAVRDATNQSEFLERLQREAGLTVQVLSGEEEARLGARAALWSLSLREGTVVDLGGGSLQLTHIRQSEVVTANSFPLGVVRTNRQFLRNDPPTALEIQALRREVRHHGQLFFQQDPKGRDLIGLGGTIRTLGRMQLMKTGQQRTRQGLRLQRTDVTALRKQCERLSVRERLRLPGLKAERADIILPGAIVVEEVMKLGKHDTLTVCTDGVRQGFLLREVFGAEISHAYG